jgi:hypothetical protein
MSGLMHRPDQIHPIRDVFIPFAEENGVCAGDPSTERNRANGEKTSEDGKSKQDSV